MITQKWQRAILDIPKEGLGFDCEGQIIRKDNLVEVVKEGDLRRDERKYNFCSKGKIGRAIETLYGHTTRGDSSWVIIVEFDTSKGKKTVGCVDYYLRLIQ